MEPDRERDRTESFSGVVMGKITNGGTWTNGYFPVPRSILRGADGEAVPTEPGEDLDDATPTAIVERQDAGR